MNKGVKLLLERLDSGDDHLRTIGIVLKRRFTFCPTPSVTPHIRHTQSGPQAIRRGLVQPTLVLRLYAGLLALLAGQRAGRDRLLASELVELPPRAFEGLPHRTPAESISGRLRDEAICLFPWLRAQREILRTINARRLRPGIYDNLPRHTGSDTAAASRSTDGESGDAAKLRHSPTHSWD